MEISKNVALLTFLYFIQGLPYGFQARYLPVFLRSQGLSLTSLGFFKLLLAPWLCKALWAPLVDKYGTKRKWLLWSVFGLIVTCATAVFISPANITLLCLVLFSLNLCAATQDIAVDSIAVSVLSGDDLGQGNTAQVVGYKIGSVFGGGVLVWFIDAIGWSGLFILMTLLYVEAWMFVFVSPRLRNLDLDIENVMQESSPQKHLDSNILPTEEVYELHEDIEGEVTDEGNGQSVNGEMEIQDTSEDTKDKDIRIVKNQSRQWRGFVLDIWCTPGTRWILVFVLLYKLGEQGVTSMVPLYLVDKKVASADITFWAGMVGQGISIIGSLLGGWVISYYKVPVWLTLSQVTLLRVMPMGIILQLVLFWENRLFSAEILYYASVLSYSLLMFFSGVITTATFTCMMQCSQHAPASTQATHYTILASIEVMGKLAFASICGYLVDLLGYSAVFLIFVVLAALVIPMFKAFPEALRRNNVLDEQESGEDNGNRERKKKAV